MSSFRREVPCTLASIQELESDIAGLLAGTAMAPARSADLLLALHEALCNVLQHTSQPGVHPYVQVEFEHLADGLAISVRDRGPGFAPEDLPNPLGSKALLESGGRGILLMRSLVDQVEFARVAGGMLVRLIQHI